MSSDAPTTGLSLVVPVFNEHESLATLASEVRAALSPHFDWQLVLVDDGSTDGSPGVLAALEGADPRIDVVHLPCNMGQSAAIWAGLMGATRDLVATMDADLQQDPRDLAALHRVLGTGDAAIGYREVRRDGWLRRVGSRIGNGVRNAVTGHHVRDSGCSLRIIRRAAFESLVPFDGMHRFLPTLLRQGGHHVVEHPVSHRPRAFGQSKYGTWRRAVRGISDVFAVRWLGKRLISNADLPPGTQPAAGIKTQSERRPPRSA